MNHCVICRETTESDVCDCGCAVVSHDPDVSPEVSLGEGGTPVVETTPSEDDVADAVLVKDEAANPTGTVHDRGAAAALTALDDRDVDETSSPSTGDSAVSLAAYAARCNVELHAYVPARARFDVKAMVNVHGGDMTVVQGRYDDAVEAFESSEDDRPLHQMPEYLGGVAAVADELDRLEDVDVDHVVTPAGTGAVAVAVLSADVTASVHVVQPTGCSPYVDSVERGDYVPCTEPDTVVGECEVPEPPEEFVRTAIEAADDGRLELHRATDADALDACLSAARDEGVDLSPAGGAAYSVAEDLGGTTVAVNPAAGRFSADALRNRLVYHGE